MLNNLHKDSISQEFQDWWASRWGFKRTPVEKESSWQAWQESARLNKRNEFTLVEMMVILDCMDIAKSVDQTNVNTIREDIMLKIDEMIDLNRKRRNKLK